MSQPQVRIRTAAPADIDQMLTLLHTAGLPVEGVAAACDNYLVAEDNEKIVALGGLELHGPDALLRSLAVTASYRNSGLGRRICDRLRQRAEAKGSSDVYLLTTTAADFFERLGFVRIARESAPDGIRRSPEFSGICPVSAVLMRRTANSRG